MTEKRATRRVPIDASVQIRPAGASGRNIPCTVRDSSPEGLRLRCLEAMDPDWYWIEILTSTGTPADEPIEARVVWRNTDADGYEEIGCTFDE